MPEDNAIVELLKEIGRLHKELSSKYEELSMYFYPDDKDYREGSSDDDEDDYDD